MTEGRNKTVEAHNKDPLKTVLDHLADPILEMSDEEILAEIRETGVDPQEVAEHTRAVLLEALQKFDNVNRRLWHLGHNIRLKDWQLREWGYENTCADCGLSVSLATSSKQPSGRALESRCTENQNTSLKRDATRK